MILLGFFFQNYVKMKENKIQIFLPSLIVLELTNPGIQALK